MYLLDCSYSRDSKTEKCLEMGWNCQNTLGSIVSYRIRESKCFTLSRFEKWVSYVPTRLLVFSGFENRKMSEMGWNCQNTLGSIVSYRILRESKCFTLSRFEKWVSYVPTRLLVFSGFENRKMSRNGLKLSKYVRKYRFLSHTSRIEMFYSFKIWEVGFVCTYWFVRILVIRKPKNVSKWVEIVKIR